MLQDDRRLHRALAARDARFDGLFFVGITSTRIYCRPICPAKLAREANRRFFATAQEAEQAGFRPCLRCRPELAPGSAPVDDAQRVAQLIVQRLEEGQLDGSGGLEEIAAQFELSSRQIRRIVQSELGVPPIQLLLTRRLLLAKQLLTETRLPITEVAFASGFSSLRRFNDAFAGRYGMPPTRLRRRAASGDRHAGDSGTSTLMLAYRPPYDWAGMLAFLSARALTGIEHVTPTTYSRTVQLGKAKGWITVSRAGEARARSGVSTRAHTGAAGAAAPPARALRSQRAPRRDRVAPETGRASRGRRARQPRPAGAGRVQRFRDGAARDSRPAGDGEGGHDHRLPVRRDVRRADRHADARTEPPHAAAGARRDRFRGPDRPARHRGGALPQHHRAGQGAGLADLCLDEGVHRDPDASIERLAAIPGIGQWTAHYIAMRALRWPDAFPKEDIAVRKRLGGVTAKEADLLSQAWRPWRSYAVMHLWRMAGIVRDQGVASAFAATTRLRPEVLAQ
jgi:AraC family transcriptional regulator of adaptative response / DNA-3-methyladenine glycosylase II